MAPKIVMTLPIKFDLALSAEELEALHDYFDENLNAKQLAKQIEEEVRQMLCDIVVDWKSDQ